MRKIISGLSVSVDGVVFAGEGDPVALKLATPEAFSNGVLHLTYQRGGN